MDETRVNRTELVRRVHADLQAAGVRATRDLVGEIVVRAFECISESLLKDEAVVVTNFGTFRPQRRKAFETINVSAGGALHVPATISVRFKTGSILKRRLNGLPPGPPVDAKTG